jgi:hypothetical protein
MDISLEEQKNSLIENQEVSPPSNLHRVIRHIFLMLCIFIAISIVLLLVYKNGKSIYDKGI